MTTLFYLLMLAVPFCVLFFSLHRRHLQGYFYRGDSDEQWLHHLPGSVLLAPKTASENAVLFVPYGNCLAAGWHLWAFSVGMLGVQLIHLLDALRKTGWWRSISAFFRNVLILIAELFLAAGLFSLINNESLFFRYAVHQTAFWLTTVPMLILGQFCCERLFERVDQ